MKMFQIIVLALSSTFALTAILAATATATPGQTLPAEWLVNGSTLSVGLLFTFPYEVLEVEPVSHLDLLCSRILVGIVGPNNRQIVTLVEDLEGHEVTEISSTRWINCIIHLKGSCEEANEDLVEVFPLHLPWEGLAELIVNEKSEEVFVDLLVEGTGGKPGFLVECKILGITGDITCTGEIGELLANSTSDVLSEASEADKIVTPNLHCTSVLGEDEGETESFGGLIENSEGTLSVSSP